MSRLIVLSNRVSLPHKGQKSAGGLAVALEDALQAQGGIWLGWNGEQIQNGERPEFIEQQHLQVHYITTPLTVTEYQDFYSGFANNTLWPMLHNRSDLMREDPEQFAVYQQVNQRFAEKIAQIAQPDDIIWVHDYHFFSVAKYCRQLGLNNRIGFFLHIPWSPLQYWQQLSVAKNVLQDMLAFDVLGVQTQVDQQTCIEVYKSFFESSVQKNTILHHKRQVLIQAYPIGIDAKLIQKAAQGNTLQLADYFDPCPELNQPLVVAAERTDYSKGIPERVDAIEALLHEKALYGRFAGVQVACPCRMEVATYQKLYQQVNQRINSLNQALKSEDWQPIYLTNDMVPHHDLMQLYRKSAVGWVNSLKDGMNLVAKEYIAAQDPHNPGVLILSRYAGAAEQMQEALIVNPHDINDLKKALYQALNMSLSERIQRYKALMHGIMQHDIHAWREQFLTDLKAVSEVSKSAV